MSPEDILAQLAEHGCQDITDRLDLAKCNQTPVSTGGFGNVYLGSLKTGGLVAIKCPRLRIDTKERKKEFKRSAHELYVWSKCDHPNVMPLLGVSLYQGQIAMVSPWMEHGSMAVYLSRHPQVDPCGMCAQVADGVAYLHKEGVVHGDIKGANIVVSGDHIPKLGDFGTSVLHEYTLEFATTTGEQQITLRWTAPEIFMSETGHTVAGDVYAMGMTVLEAFTGAVPYSGMNDVGVMSCLYRKVPPTRPVEHFPIDNKRANFLWLLLHKCWAANPQERPDSRTVADKLWSMTEDAMKYAIFDDKMGITQVLERLAFHGCIDVTDKLLDGDHDYREPAKQLSVGMFSQIYFGALRDGSSIAIKSLRVAKTVFKGEVVEDWNIRPHINIAHELYVRSQCVHPHILELIGAAEFRGRLATISPLMQNGDMYQFLARKPDVNLCNMCEQLASAVTYLHRKDIAHGGIQLSNILVSEDSKVKLAGFGGAILCNSPVEFKGYHVDNNHALIWMAPELLEGRDRQSFQSDVYALGVAILQIVTRAEVYHDSNGVEVQLRGHLRTTPPRRPKAHLPPNNKESNRLWDMLTCCWEPGPENRPTAPEVGNIIKSISDEGLGGVNLK